MTFKLYTSRAVCNRALQFYIDYVDIRELARCFFTQSFPISFPKFIRKFNFAFLIITYCCSTIFNNLKSSKMPSAVDKYIARYPAEIQKLLQKIREVIRKEAP